MKLRTISTTLALTATLGLGLITPSHSQTQDSCPVFACMASISGFGVPKSPNCAAPIVHFHRIQVWDKKFNPRKTAKERRDFLMTCPGATAPDQAIILEAVITQWGYTP